MEVTAAVARTPGAPLEMAQLRMDAIQPDEVLVRVVAVGICHTDLAVQHGHIPVPLPAVLGHEGAGIVEAIGADVTGLRPGDHVIMSQALCGNCRQCQLGEPAYCEHAARLSLGGCREDGSSTLTDSSAPLSGNFVGQSSFATHAITKARNSYRVAADLPLDVLAPVGCGVMTGVGAVLNDARLQAGQSIAVFGCGTVGLASIMAAKAAGASQIVAVDLNESRLELAVKLGATHAVASGESVAASVRDVTLGGADVAIEAAGVPSVASAAVAATRSRGRTVIVGAAPYGSRLDLDWWQVAAGRTVQGSVVGSADPAKDIPRLVDMWRAGHLPLADLIRTYPFAAVNQAITDMASGSVIKPVLLM